MTQQSCNVYSILTKFQKIKRHRSNLPGVQLGSGQVHLPSLSDQGRIKHSCRNGVLAFQNTRLYRNNISVLLKITPNPLIILIILVQDLLAEVRQAPQDTDRLQRGA